MLTRDDAPPPMKLSTAIRLGAMLKPQTFGQSRGNVPVPHVGDILTIRFVEGTCAFGAAFDAAPMVQFLTGASLIGVNGCPACASRHVRDLAIAVIHLNDGHRWTREQIADFVEGVEAAQATERPPEADACCSPSSVPLSVR